MPECQKWKPVRNLQNGSPFNYIQHEGSKLALLKEQTIAACQKLTDIFL